MIWRTSGKTSNFPSDRMGSRVLFIVLIPAVAAGCAEGPTGPPEFPLFDVDPISGCPVEMHAECCPPALTCSCTRIEDSQVRADLWNHFGSWGEGSICRDGGDGAIEMFDGDNAYWLDEAGGCANEYGGHAPDLDFEGPGVIYARRGPKNPADPTGDQFTYVEQLQTLWHEGLSAKRCSDAEDLEEFQTCHSNLHILIDEGDYDYVCFEGPGHPDPV